MKEKIYFPQENSVCQFDKYNNIIICTTYIPNKGIVPIGRNFGYYDRVHTDVVEDINMGVIPDKYCDVLLPPRVFCLDKFFPIAEENVLVCFANKESAENDYIQSKDYANVIKLF